MSPCLHQRGISEEAPERVIKVVQDIDDHGNEVQDSNLNKKFTDVVLGLKAATTFVGKGDMVKFSGFFKQGKRDENECLRAGLEGNPELVMEGFDFKFTKIEKMVPLKKD